MKVTTAFVTGASGLIGTGIVESLRGSGRPVTALVRSRASAEALRAKGCRPMRGDIRDDPRHLAEGMRDCDVVYHVAGVNAHCLVNPEPLFETNVLGSHNVVQACLLAGVRRLVYTSSAAVIGEEHGTVGTETTPHRGRFLSHYERSKYEAERAVFRAAAGHDLEVVAVNPASVQGPGRTTGTAKLLLDYVNGRLRTAVETTTSVVDIEDCVEGHVLAETKADPGNRYILSGASIKISEAMALMGEVTGFAPRVVMVPPSLALCAATTAGLWGRVRGRPPTLCRELMRTLLHGHRYDGSRAERDLGLTYTPLAESIKRTHNWYVQHGLAPPAASRA